MVEYSTVQSVAHIISNDGREIAGTNMMERPTHNRSSDRSREDAVALRRSSMLASTLRR